MPRPRAPCFVWAAGLRCAAPATSTRLRRTCPRCTHGSVQVTQDAAPRDAPMTVPAVSRRAMLVGAAGTAVAAALSPLSACLAADSSTVVDTPVYSYVVPPGFTESTASLSGGRILTVFVNDEDGDTNISMVQTPVQGDFRKLTSFGSVDNVISNIVPRSVPGNKLISVEQSPQNNAYVIEYQIKPSGELPLRHLITVFSLQPGQSLCTLTGQATEENWAAKEKLIKEIMSSYRLKLRE